MNCVYFACKTCELYIDAGYRWTQTLPDSIKRGQSVDRESILSATEYWRGVKGNDYLRILLQRIKAFLDAHQEHEVIFAEEDDFHHFDARSLGWMEIDHSSNDKYFWGPRDFVEKLGYTRWEQVVEHIAGLEWGNWWFENMELRFEGRRKFEWFVRAQSKIEK